MTDSATITREIHRETMDTGRLTVIPDMALESDSMKRNGYDTVYPPNYVSKPRLTSINALVMDPLLNAALETRLVISDGKNSTIGSNSTIRKRIDSGGVELKRKTKSMAFIKHIDIPPLEHSYSHIQSLENPEDSIGGPRSWPEISVYDEGSWDVCVDCSDVDDVQL
ncbi:hypothetical protein CORC01_13952 [Colletotrichum orchidophilum]|uniref:Uncharacterized protein n=1 Tax=Colletotrichum orchidophilum TaxID=1209926 RepID=A0A1G4ANT4_9PEZI|nr:uncharacterized protein CORC01_13952 [Colletotrichum orchidophilum]OHE90755.1 hypothetical protein CORC01_13952 [Colletotrichum orchidophilum]